MSEIGFRYSLFMKSLFVMFKDDELFLIWLMRMGECENIDG